MDVTDDAMKEVFARLRPMCVTLTRHTTRVNLAELNQLLKDVTDRQLSLLLEYVLFPLRLYIKQPNRNAEVCRDVVVSLNHVISRSPITKVDVLEDLFNSLCILISGPGTQLADYPEELKLSVVECLTCLIGGCKPAVRNVIYMLPFLPALGHAVSLFINLMSSEQFRQLQAAAGKCLLQLLSADIKDAEMHCQVGRTFSSFLPGITMAMTRIATQDIKQGHAVTKVSLDVWTTTVAMVMGNDSLGPQQATSASTELKSNLLSDIDVRLAELSVSRSAEWVKETAEKLQILVNKITPLVTHDNWKVRLALVSWATSLLVTCSGSMPDASSGALDVLVQLAADEYDVVSQSSQRALEAVRAQMELDGSRHLVEVLEENLHELATRLPRLIRSVDDALKLSTLILFNGYLKLLGSRLHTLLLSAPHLQRMSIALIYVMEFDTSNLELVQEAHTGFQLSLGSGLTVGTAAPRFYFKHFSDDRIHAQVNEICHVLGEYGDLDLLIDNFLDLAYQGITYRKQSFYIINEIIVGIKGNESRQQLPRIIMSLLEVYLSPQTWCLHTQAVPTTDFGSNTSAYWQIVPACQKAPNVLTQRTSNILQICILLEGISKFAQVMGEDFQPHLVDVIYPLMEKLGDPLDVINCTAQRVAFDIATACRYRDVHTLVCANSDYLVNGIALRLKHIDRYPNSPCVLQSVLKYSTSDILPLFEDIIEEVFTVLDDHYDRRGAVLMQVLYNLTAAISHWHTRQHSQLSDQHHNLLGPPPAKTSKLSDTVDETEKSTSRKHTQDNQILMSFLHDYQKLKVDTEFDMQTTEQDSASSSEEMISQTEGAEVDEDMKIVPKHIQVVKQILERCCHLLSAPETRLRLLVLRTIAEGCIVMHSEQNELLPMAHKLWSPFVKRFQDDEPLVALEAIKTFKTLCLTTGDFLRRRIVEEVLPAMSDFLIKRATFSGRAGVQYKYMVLSKLQVAAIQTISSICKQVCLKGRLLYRVATACLPYLSTTQPQHLQQASLDAFVTFIETDADSIWLLLVEQYSPSPLTPPDTRFTNNKVGSSKASEFMENITYLLTLTVM